MTQKLLLEEINVKNKMISCLHDIIDQQQKQIDYYRSMILSIDQMMKDVKLIIDGKTVVILFLKRVAHSGFMDFKISVNLVLR